MDDHGCLHTQNHLGNNTSMILWHISLTDSSTLEEKFIETALSSFLKGIRITSGIPKTPAERRFGPDFLNKYQFYSTCLKPRLEKVIIQNKS